MHARRPFRVHALLVALVAFPFLHPARSSAAVVPVTACGMTIVGRAELVGDLDCSAYAGHALALDGTLELNGFTLTGNTGGGNLYDAVHCTGRCRVKVKGPGTIVGGSVGVSGIKVLVTGEVTVHDAGEWGVLGAILRVVRSHVHTNGVALGVGADGGGGVNGGTVSVVRSTIENNASYGVNATVRATLHLVDATDNGIVDVRSDGKPTAVKTTCKHSARESLAETWGICALD